MNDIPAGLNAPLPDNTVRTGIGKSTKPPNAEQIVTVKKIIERLKQPDPSPSAPSTIQQK